MNQKIGVIVASMSVLGLISFPAFAANTQHHMKNQQDTSSADYKALGALPVVCPIVDPASLTLDAMHQNLGRAKPTEDCTKLISFAGGINFDAHWGNRGKGYQGENYQRVSLNDAYLNIFGNVNDWVKAMASLSYGNPTQNLAASSGTLPTTVKSGQYSNVYSVNNLNLEQGFIRVGDFNQSPFYAQVGKQFQDFGRYTIHPLTRTMTQVMSESLQTSAEVGFLTQMGFNGAIYAFDAGLTPRSSYALTTVQGHTSTDFGAALGFARPNEQLGFDLGAEYLYDMTGVNDVAQAISLYQSGNTSNTNGSYNNRVSGLALHADVNSGPFSLLARYVTALQTFSNNDLGNQGLSAVAAGTGNGSKPVAGDLQAGFNFNNWIWSKNQNVYIGYQASRDAVNLFLPQSRWLVGYNIDVWKNTNVGLEVGHDTDYSVTRGGTGNSSNTIGLRGAVKFG